MPLTLAFDDYSTLIDAFDVLGAQATGWRTAWVRRNSELVFDPWGVAADIEVHDLSALASLDLSLSAIE